MIYDYKDMLQVDDETYEIWEPTIAIHERQALNKLKAFGNELHNTSENKREYAENAVLLAMYADDMSKSVETVYRQRQQEIEQGVRFGALV